MPDEIIAPTPAVPDEIVRLKWFCVCTVCDAAEMVTALPACDRVMLFPPARVIVPEEIPASAPDVLLEIVRLNRFCV